RYGVRVSCGHICYIGNHLSTCQMIRRAQRSSLSPYTTLFRSQGGGGGGAPARPGELLRGGAPPGPGVGRADPADGALGPLQGQGDRKSTRLNSSHVKISYAVFCLKKNKELIKTM